MRRVPLFDATAGRYAPPVAAALCVLVASVVDPPTSAAPTAGPLGVVGVDKWLHAAGYGLVGFLAARALGGRTRRTVALAVLTVTAFGAGVELAQAFVPSRTFDLLDAAANAVGAVAGVLCRVAVVAANGDDV